MELREITEGKTRLIIPIFKKLSRKNKVFFNPDMELSRDISIAVAGLVPRNEFCDVLAGSGARGVRMATELDLSVVLNDKNPSACELIRRNVELNGVESRVRIENQDANLLLARERFEFIDVDPFGSPAPFMDSAMRSIRNEGTIAATATDTSALCGTYPRACRRKYDAVSLKTDYYNEAGLRLLVGFIARAALRYNIAIKPLFSHCSRHYFRTYLRVFRSKRKANQSIKNVGYVQHCFNCLNRRVTALGDLMERCECGGKLNNIGPLWIAEFADPGFCEEMEEGIARIQVNNKAEILKLVRLVRGEQKIGVPYYNIHKIFKKVSAAAMPMEKIFGMLENGGFICSRTHFSGLGVRTDAGISDIYDILS